MQASDYDVIWAVVERLSDHPNIPNIQFMLCSECQFLNQPDTPAEWFVEGIYCCPQHAHVLITEMAVDQVNTMHLSWKERQEYADYKHVDTINNMGFIFD